MEKPIGSATCSWSVMTAGGSIAIVGATGVTGAFAFDEASRIGLAPLALGRDAEKLRAFVAKRGLPEDRFKVVDISSVQDLRRALAGTEAVISTIMPFSVNGLQIARAAAEMGLGYTDPSGETGFVREVIDSFDLVAQKTGASLCPGNGAAAFLGDIALRWILEPTKHSVGGVLYDIREYQPSFGSFKSYIAVILPGGGARIRKGQIETRPFAFCAGSVQGIAGYHSVVPDALVVSRYWNAKEFDALGKSGSLPRPLVRGLASCVSNTMLSKLLLMLPFDRWLAYDPAADAKSSITAHVQCGVGDGTFRRRTVRGRGIYPLTGRILAATANAMVNRGMRPTGVRAASEMFTSFEEALTQTGLDQVENVGVD
jgi:Saccharopine dehydrogenase NADP binding domain